MKMNDKASPIFDKWEKLYYEENDKYDYERKLEVKEI